MKRNGLNFIILISSLMALSSCVKEDSSGKDDSSVDRRREVSFSFNGFQTVGKKPFMYVEEGMKYVPVTISFQKGREKGNLEIKHFTLSSPKPVSIFKDLNNNKVLDDAEMVTLVDIGQETSVEWISDTTPNKDDSVLSANYMLYSEGGFEDNTIVSYCYEADAIALEKYCEGETVYVSIYIDKYKRAPSSIVLLYDRPEEHITINAVPDQNALYKTTVSIKDDGVLKVLGVENAEFYISKDNTYRHYKYEGLDGEIIVKYAVNIKDRYYSDKDINFGEGEYKYIVPVNGHEHTVSTPTKVSAMNVYSCGCNVFEAYELDSLRALDPTEPDLNNPAEMMGNQMFRIEWNVSGIKKGRYKVYVHGSTRDSQSNLKWFTREDNASSHCPSYIRIGETEKQPCTDKTFGETFGTDTGWRWTSDYIFDINIPENLEILSIQSGNNNGRLNDYNMFVRGLLLVPYSESFSPSNL